MADDPNKIEIELAVRDSMSAGLKEIGRQLDVINRKALETGLTGAGGLEKFSRQSSQLQDVTQRTTRSLTGMGDVMTGMAKSLLGPVGLAAAFVGLGKSVENFAESQVQLRGMATNTGLAVGQLRELQQGARRLGMSLPEANQAIGTLSSRVESLSVHKWGELFQNLGTMGAAGAKLGTDMMHAGSNMDRITMLLQAFPKQSREAQVQLAEFFGVSVDFLSNISKAMGENVKAWDTNIEKSDKWHQQWITIEETFKNIKDSVFGSIVEGLTNMNTQLDLGEVSAKKFAAALGGEFAKFFQDVSKFITDMERLNTWIGKHGGEGDPLKTAPPVPQSESDLNRMIRRFFKQQNYEGGDEGTGGFKRTAWDVIGDRDQGIFQQASLRETLEASARSYQPSGPTIPLIQNPYGVPGFLKHDAERGHPARTALRGMFGIQDPGEPAPWQPGGSFGGGDLKELSDTEADSNILLRDVRDILQRMEIGGGGGGPAGVGGGPMFRPGIGPGGRTGGGAAPTAPGEAGEPQVNYFQRRGDQPLSREQTSTVETPFGKVAAHPEAAVDVEGFFNKLGEQGAPIRQLGSYNYRQKRWGGGMSSHAYGAAWDIDDQVELSPHMKDWIAKNPDAWEQTKREFNMRQPLPQQDPAHVEWTGPNAGTRGRFAAFSGRVSTFDDKVVAPGGSSTTPGIALRQKIIPGQLFDVTDPATGRTIRVPQTDWGPSEKTGRAIDVNRPLAEQFGYKERNFPTDATWSVREHIDKSLGKVGAAGPNGTLNAEVDFKNVPPWVRVGADGDGFKTLKVNRSRQAAQAGEATLAPGDPGHSTWSYE